jgi:hypothetical protein
MRLSLQGGNGPHLVELDLKLNLRLLQDYVQRSDGLWGHLRHVLFALVALWVACAWQSGVFDGFPELPFCPLLNLCVVFAARRRLIYALALAFVGGLWWDAVFFLPLGTHSALLGAVVWGCHKVSVQPWAWQSAMASHWVLAGVSRMIYVCGGLCLMGGGMAWGQRIALLPKHLAGGILLDGVCFLPMLFWTMDGLAALILPRHSVRESYSERP